MATLLLISNGHGEDISGALLGRELQTQGHDVQAFPLVGKGIAYQTVGIKLFGLRKEFSTGGLGYTTFFGRIQELMQGQLFYLIWSFFRLYFVAKRYDALVVVGDVVPVMASWLSNRKFIVYLVAYSSHYEGRLRLPWPAAQCLRSKRCLQIFSRDQLTSDDLSSQLNRPVLFLGNPFMDPILTPKKQLPQRLFRLGLLPGSRRPELDHNLLMILRVLQCLPTGMLCDPRISFDMALVEALEEQDLCDLTLKEGWTVSPNSSNSKLFVLENGYVSVNVYRNSFVELLQSSDACLCMAGTAAEQAIGLAKPVIQLPGRGPQFTSSFAEAQRRLLGKTVVCAETKVKDRHNIFVDTAELIEEIYSRLKNDKYFRDLCVSEASMRLGKEGGTKRIVQLINDLIANI